MNETMLKIKKFFKNKNTITVIGVIIILGILYWGYSSTINDAISPVNVPVAKERILPETQITSDMVKYVKVAKSAVSEDAILNTSNILGLYTNIHVTIPEGSMFYSDWLIEEEELPGNWIEKIDYENGFEAYYFPVNTTITFGNSIKPHTRIDLYVFLEDENEQPIFGKVLENIEVLVVKDSSGNNVFRDYNDIGTPAYFGLALDVDYYVLLKQADYLDIDVIVAPHGTEIAEDGIEVSAPVLAARIAAQFEELPDAEIEEDTPEEDTPEIEEEVVQ